MKTIKPLPKKMYTQKQDFSHDFSEFIELKLIHLTLRPSQEGTLPWASSFRGLHPGSSLPLSVSVGPRRCSHLELMSLFWIFSPGAWGP